MHRYVDFGPAKSGVSMLPDSTNVVGAATYPYTAKGLVVDGIKPAAGAALESYMCPRVYDTSTAPSANSYGAGDGVFMVVDLGVSGGVDLMDAVYGHAVEAVVVHFASSLVSRTNFQAEVGLGSFGGKIGAWGLVGGWV